MFFGIKDSEVWYPVMSWGSRSEITLKTILQQWATWSVRFCSNLVNFNFPWSVWRLKYASTIWLNKIYTGCPKINFTFLKFCSFKVNLPLQHQKHNLLEETCRIFLIPNMYQLVTSKHSKMVWKFTGVDTLYHSLLQSLPIPGIPHSGVHKLGCSCTQSRASVTLHCTLHVIKTITLSF